MIPQAPETMKRSPRSTPLVLLCLVAALSAGCDMVDRYVTKSPRDALAEAALSRWAAPGGPFLEGVSGRDTVASVSPTGAHAWEVAVVPLSGGAPTVWSLDLPEIEVYRVFSGPDFAPWLERRARELGMRTFIPPEVAGEIRSGQILAVGHVQVRYGPASGSGRNTEDHIAYLVPLTSEEDAQWHMQPVTRSASVLLEALRLVADDMVRKDDRVMTCMRSASPAGVPRDKQLECVGDALKLQFAGS